MTGYPVTTGPSPTGTQSTGTGAYLLYGTIKFPHVSWETLTQTRNENVDVWVRKKIFLRERK